VILESVGRYTFALVVTLVVSVGVVHPAHAQDSSVAERLFREGKKLMGEKKYAEACKAFEGSYRKDAAVTTLMNLADCREKNLQFATAWGYFLDVVRISRERSDAAAFGAPATARAQKLESKLSYLIINVPAASHVEGLHITRNGVDVDEAEWNTDIPIDGGEYIIEGKAPGYEAWSTKIIVGPANDKKSINVPSFRARPVTDVRDVQPPPDGGKPGTGGNITTPVGPERDTGGDGGKKTAIIVISGGAAVLVGGLAVGYLSMGKWRDAQDICGADRFCDNATQRAEAEDIIKGAKTLGNVSTALVASGAIIGGAGTYLYIRARKKSSEHASLRVTPVVSGEAAALVIGGHF
jgi:hypothetical protein